MKLSQVRNKVQLLLLLLLFALNATAQVTIINDSFDDGNISASPTWSNNTNRFTVSSSSPLSGSHSLVTNTSNNVSSIHTMYATNTNLTSANYTWNLLYRANTNNNPDELAYGAAINSGHNHWRFWIAANSTDATNCEGFYISHSAGNLKFARKKNNGTWDIATFAISLNTTYSIKIVRRYDGYWDWYVDAGTAEATTNRWSGWATDVFNSGNSDIYMLLHANETSANRFKFDNAGLFSKSLTIGLLSNGVFNGAIEEGATDVPVFGFSASAIGTITLEDVQIQNTNSNSQGNFVNFKLYKSVDNDFSTTGDNTLINGLTFSLNGNEVFIENINTTINNNSTVNFFLTLDNINNNGGSPPPNIQFSMTCNGDCGVPYSTVVTTNADVVNDFSIAGNNYDILRVFTWKNTTTVGDFTDNWQNSSAWEPNRTSPNVNDVLVFSKGGSVTPLNIPVQTAKRIVIRNNTNVTINTSSLSNASATLTVGNGNADDFEIEAGSSLNVTSTGNTLSIVIPSGTTAGIAGNLTFSGNNHVISAADANAIKFKSGSKFTGGNALTGNAFGSSVPSSVIFESGSTLEDQVGLDYFSAQNVISFNAGSTYKHASSSTASLNNKTVSNFELASGATFSLNANTLTVQGDILGTGTLVMTSGELNLLGNYTNTGTLTAGTGTINYAGENQNVKAANYANINFTYSGIKTLLGNIVFAISNARTLNLENGVQLVCGANTITANTASSVININGYLITSNVNGLSGSTSTTLRSTNSPSITLANTSTIEYNSSSTQAISARTDYANLIASGTGTKNAGSLTINGSLQVNSGVILNMSTNAIAGSFTTTGTGTLRYSNTGTTPLPAGLTWSFTVDANGSSQSVVGGTYTNLTLTGSGTKTARGNISVSSNLNINAGRTFTMGTFLLQQVGTTSGTGTLRTDNTSANPIPSNVTWTYTVLYNGASQTVVEGNYKGLSIAGSGTKTAAATINMDGALNIASGNIFNVQSFLIDGMTSTVGTGRLTTLNTSNQPLPSNFTWTFTVEYAATNADQYVVPGDYTSLLFSGARTTNNLYVANNANINLSSSLTASATFTSGAYIVTGNNFIYDGAAQNVTAFTYHNLSIEGTGDKTAAGNITVNNNLNIASGRILLMSTRQLFGVTSTSGEGTLRTAYTSTNAIPANDTWNFTVDYNTSSSQIIAAGNYSNLLISGTRTTNSITLINGGTIAVSNTFTPSATFTSGNYIRTNNTFNFNGDVQNIPAFTFNNLTLSGNGDKSLTGTVQVLGLLSLDNSSLTLNGNTLELAGSFSRTNASIKAGTCQSPSGNIEVSGSGAQVQLALNETNYHLNNLTINRANNVELITDISIHGTLTLTNGSLLTNAKLIFDDASAPIVRTSGTISLNSDASLQFGDCSTAGSAFNIPNDVFINTNFKNLTINRTNGIVLGNQLLSISGTLRILAGTLNTNNNLVLTSTATSTARVDSIKCIECDVIGNIRVERYIPGGVGKRRWRLLASPVNVNGFTPASDIIDDILVTGPGGASKGFDPSPNNTGSIKTYRESDAGSSNSGWLIPSKIDTAFQTGKGLCVFVRGDRNVEDPFITWAPSNNVTMDFTGALNIGNIALPVSYTNTNSSADGWNLVANPYASQINWNASNGWTANNLQTKIWLYNPTTGTYGIYDHHLNLGTNGSTPYIASGQSFFVKATAANPSLVINESAKVDSVPSNFFRASSISNLLRITLNKDSLNSDEAVLYLSETGTGGKDDASDAQKFFNDEMNFYLRSKNGFNLAINEHPIPDGFDTVYASIFSYAGQTIWTGDYELNFSGIESFVNTIDVYLEDTYLNKIVDIREQRTYTFQLTEDVASMGNNRFRILLGKNNNPTGVEQSIAKSNFKVFPNPFNDELNLRIETDLTTNAVEYSIYNQFGQMVETNKVVLENYNFSLNTSTLASGIYFIRIKTDEFVETKKLIKK
jgi:hypothetical protein